MLDEHDHRSLGARLDLFHLQEEAPGMVFWHPRGLALYRLLEERVRARIHQDGYREVRSPQVLHQHIWEQSGHWQHFRSDMLLVGEDHPFALKPVSCPGHLQLVRRMNLSYRDLPLRLAEFGLVHRNEPSGALHGLFRLRQFCQDDGHIFCAPEQVDEEVARFCASLRAFYAAFGFERLEVAFSSRPAQRAGDDAVWDRAEAALRAAARSAGLEAVEQPGQGAFYGPKLEFALRDRLGRAWQCGTIQLDLVLPERFDVAYVDAKGKRQRPAMLHRAILGSLERFLGVLLEHHRGALPAWLSPEQAVVLPVGAEEQGYAAEVARRLEAAGVRARLDGRDLPLGKRVGEARREAVPFVLVAGPREREWGQVRLRERSGAQRDLALADAVAELASACRPPGGA